MSYSQELLSQDAKYSSGLTKNICFKPIRDILNQASVIKLNGGSL